MTRLSVLDQSPVPEGSTPGDALQNTLDLARRTEVLGYHRYWVAEHHGMDGLAGSSPEALIGSIAGATSRMRIGSGGVMLTHYAPLKVAESFCVLASLHPGRIDLGVGRAPGSDQLTAAALARGGQRLGIEYYPSQVEELLHLVDDTLPPHSPIQGVRATPRPEEPPEVWLLASSADSAAYAAHFGLPLAWADFIARVDGAPIVDAYRQQFQPSERCPEPRVLICASAVCADTDAEAERLVSTVRAWRASALRGPIPAPDPSTEGGLDPALLPKALEVQPDRRSSASGSPDHVANQLSAVVDDTGAEELMVVTICHDHEARVRSYELIAEAFGLAAASAAETGILSNGS
ncbi:MAG TPA: LLM class flavin-dependent oxidoreductase [Acidimicrobiaceae bacterium]|nr:LLM class flavin-dependent oxidoreductase [Acidimicrobiaceae bacterium]